MGQVRIDQTETQAGDQLMKRWRRVFWNSLLLPVVQVAALAIVQIVGFMLSVQLSALAPTTSVQHAARSVAAEQKPGEVHEHTADRATENDNKDESVSSPDRQLLMFGALVLACLLNAATLVFWVRTTALAGWRLIAVSFAVFFCCMTIMPQLDTLLFVRNPQRIIRSAAILGLGVSVLVAIATVPVTWRWRQRTDLSRVSMLANTRMATRMVLSVVAYVAIYLIFGYFVAWQSSELRALYGGGAHMLGFWERLITPPLPNRVIPFQIVRGCIWTLLCLFMLSFSQSNRLGAAFSIALFFAVVMNSQLLLPNPLMSQRVRHLHSIETASANFCFGLICVWLWTSRVREQAGRQNEV